MTRSFHPRDQPGFPNAIGGGKLAALDDDQLLRWRGNGCSADALKTTGSRKVAIEF